MLDQKCTERIISDDYAALIIESAINLGSFLTHDDYCIMPIDNIYSVLYTPVSKLPENLFHILGYEAFPTCFGLLDTLSLESSGIAKIRNIPNYELLGNGILIGIVDTGIDYTHNAFRNADRTTRVVSIWDQTIQSDNQPEGFFYGTEYTREQINLALTNDDPLSIVPSIDVIGHGTMLAGTATGSVSEENNFSGVVPGAEIVVVKLKQAKQNTRNFFMIPDAAICFEESDILMGINYLLSVSQKTSKPIAICIGLGTFQGGHEEFGVTSAYLSALAEQTGIAVVISGGNEGNRANHYYGQVNNNLGYDMVELRVGPGETGFSMELWGYSPNTYSIDILSPTGEYIPRIPAKLGESREIRFVLETTVIHVDYDFIEVQTGDPLILMRFQNPTEGIWRFKVYAFGGKDIRYHIWLPIHNFITDQTYFITPNPDYTLTSPGNTFNPIVTATYNYATESLYLNSGRGFTRNNSISPSIAAPGVNMIVAGLNNSYTTATGGSISAAHTTGVAAMLLQWGILLGNRPSMNSIDIRNILIRGATRRPDLTYPNKEWGFGILNLYQSFESFRQG